jgi:predicted metal-dependent HD superfamily phosphohydrolase
MASFDHDWLRSHWQQLCARLGADPAAAEEAFADLATRYSEPHRAYHNLAHIRHVLEWIDRLQAHAAHPDAVRLAGWYHDVIYDPRANDNEERSAEHAAEALRRLQLDENLIRRVADLILLTKTHEAPPDDRDAHVLLDADLAILGATDEQYRCYAEAIRKEYSWVGEHVFLNQRKITLLLFVGKQPLYQTELLRLVAEQQAHWNIRQEYMDLSNEHAWLQLGSPALALETHPEKDTISARKLQLFAAACCYQIEHLLKDESSRQALKAAEQIADGLCEDRERITAAAKARLLDLASLDHATRAVFDAVGVSHCWKEWPFPVRSALDLAVVSATEVLMAVESRCAEPKQPFTFKGQPNQMKLIRDIFGNPFRPVTMDSGWLTSDVTAIAQVIYDQRAFERMPILADALEDAGCDNRDILDHCRQPGEHVLGCWVVDLVLGKS